MKNVLTFAHISVIINNNRYMDNNKITVLLSKREEILRKLQSITNFSKGSVIEYKRYCGKKNCKCYKEKRMHTSAFLSYKEGSKSRLIPIKSHQKKEVTQWVNNNKKIKQLINEMTEINTQILRENGI